MELYGGSIDAESDEVGLNHKLRGLADVCISTKLEADKDGQSEAWRLSRFRAKPAGNRSRHLSKRIPYLCRESGDQSRQSDPALIARRSDECNDLYTCSIGSFNVYTTVEAIDCSAKTATMNFWMYNSMSRNSFGKFASHPAFALSGVKTQYMWWNWVETVDWSSGNNDNRSEDHFGTLVVMRNAAMKLLGVFLGLAWLAVIFPNLAAGQAVIASDRTVLDLGSVQVDDVLSQILDRLWRRFGAFWRFPLPRTAAARDMSRCLAAPIGEFQKLCLMSSFRS